MDKALTYFLNNTVDTLEKEEYSVGISRDVPDKYDSNYVAIEIRHIYNGRSALDARYYINTTTLKGYSDEDKEINLN